MIISDKVHVPTCITVHVCVRYMYSDLMYLEKLVTEPFLEMTSTLTSFVMFPWFAHT